LSAASARAPGPPQHLDPLDIGHRVIEIAGVGLVDAIDENADARLHRADQRGADPTDGDEGASGAIDVEAGRQLRDLADGGEGLNIDWRLDFGQQ
jgi:hypothetical protein